MAVKRVLDPGRLVADYFNMVFKDDAPLNFGNFYLIPNMETINKDEKTASIIFVDSKITGQLTFKATDCPEFVHWLFSCKDPVYMDIEALKQLRKIKKSNFNGISINNTLNGDVKHPAVTGSIFVIKTTEGVFIYKRHNICTNADISASSANDATVKYSLRLTVKPVAFDTSVFVLYASNSQLYVHDNNAFDNNGHALPLQDNSTEILCTSISNIEVLLKNPNAEYLIESTNNMPKKNNDVFNNVRITAIGERLSLVQCFKTIAVSDN